MMASEFEMKKTLINAKYCEKFVHVLWKDGRVRHVQVTGKMFREYENKMNTLLKALNTRINWLCQGSRELFGTICEEKVYILIDTSASMESRLVPSSPIPRCGFYEPALLRIESHQNMLPKCY